MSVASLEKFIHPGPWTIADVEALPETGSRFEILSPGRSHGESGRRVAPPAGVLGSDQPASVRNTVRFQPSQVQLAVEVVSPGSNATDRAVKPDLYAEAGIRFYWRLELEPQPQLLIFELGRDGYRQVGAVNASKPADATAGGFLVTLDPGELIVRQKR